MEETIWTLLPPELTRIIFLQVDHDKILVNLNLYPSLGLVLSKSGGLFWKQKLIKEFGSDLIPTKIEDYKSKYMYLHSLQYNADPYLYVNLPEYRENYEEIMKLIQDGDEEIAEVIEEEDNINVYIRDYTFNNDSSTSVILSIFNNTEVVGTISRYVREHIKEGLLMFTDIIEKHPSLQNEIQPLLDIYQKLYDKENNGFPHYLIELRFGLIPNTYTFEITATVLSDHEQYLPINLFIGFNDFVILIEEIISNDNFELFY